MTSISYSEKNYKGSLVLLQMLVDDSVKILGQFLVVTGDSFRGIIPDIILFLLSVVF